jgi:hypothetical protein
MFNIVAHLLAHSNAGSRKFLIFQDTVFIFEAQWLQCFLPLLQFLVQKTAWKTNPLQGLCALSSKTP